MTVSAFQQWLLASGYLAQTAYEYDRAVTRLVGTARDRSSWIPPLRDLERAALLRLAEYHDGLGNPELSESLRQFAARPRKTQVSKRRDDQARTRATTRSFADEDWQAISSALDAADASAARVLEVLVETGLRIGDVLSVEREALEEAVRSERVHLRTKGNKERILPYSEAWVRLLKQWKADEKAVKLDRKSKAILWPTVGCWLCRRREALSPGARDSAAYKRVSRSLSAVATSLDVAGRVHLHRIRRTVGVQALRLTRDTSTVQQMLGHASIQTTAGYLSEARPDDIAELQKQIRERFRGGSKP